MNSDKSVVDILSTFKEGVANIKEQNADDFHNQLYFSHVISLMEQFLSNLFLFEIQNYPETLQKLANHNKFRTTTVTIPFALNHSIETYMIRSMKSLVWHRLNEVEMYYKKVLNISFNINAGLLKHVERRHDLIHRNGFTIDGEEIKVTPELLNTCICAVERFVMDIYTKYQTIKN